jgi:hypothetical protein
MPVEAQRVAAPAAGTSEEEAMAARVPEAGQAEALVAAVVRAAAVRAAAVRAGAADQEEEEAAGVVAVAAAEAEVAAKAACYGSGRRARPSGRTCR